MSMNNGNLRIVNSKTKVGKVELHLCERSEKGLCWSWLGDFSSIQEAKNAGQETFEFSLEVWPNATFTVECE